LTAVNQQLKHEENVLQELCKTWKDKFKTSAFISVA